MFKTDILGVVKRKDRVAENGSEKDIEEKK